MFLKDLSTDEQRVYCELAYLMMAADGEVAEKEMAFRDRVLRELGIAALPEPAGAAVEIAEDLFRTSVSRRSLLLELAALAVADDEVTQEEVDVLHAVGAKLDVVPDEIGEMLDYAKRLREVLDEGVLLVAEGH